MPRIFERGVGISLVEVYERVGKLISRPLVKGNEDAGYDSEGREICHFRR